MQQEPLQLPNTLVEMECQVKATIQHKQQQSNSDTLIPIVSASIEDSQGSSQYDRSDILDKIKIYQMEVNEKIRAYKVQLNSTDDRRNK